MPKFQKKYQQSFRSEIPEDVPITEGPVDMSSLETDIVDVAESPEIIPGETAEKKACGINGCITWYDDPTIMQRHRERVHGVGIKNLNQPQPRNKNIKVI